MKHEDETLDYLDHYSKQNLKQEKKTNHRSTGKFTLKSNEKNNYDSIFKIIGIITIILILITIYKNNSTKTDNPIIGKWVKINQVINVNSFIEFTEDTMIRSGMSIKVNYKIYNDKVEVKPNITFVESPLGFVYYIKDQNTIIEDNPLGRNFYQKIK